jgi:hypothetical protein
MFTFYQKDNKAEESVPKIIACLFLAGRGPLMVTSLASFQTPFKAVTSAVSLYGISE